MTNSQQFSKYGTRGGHGFSAEDANALDDFFLGNNVDKCGWKNTLNGADRIVNNVPIQSKYCRSASCSVNSAFNGAHGNYRYTGQKLEVPRDQYNEALKIMREKILNKQVPGVTDPAKASDIVKCGNYTYDEAIKLAKAGTAKSICFDLKAQSVTCISAAGLSGVVSYISARNHGLSPQEALKQASKDAGWSAAFAMGTGVATQQFLRTTAGRATEKAIENVAKAAVKEACKSHIGRVIVAQNAIGSAGKAAATEAGKKVAMASAKRTAAAALKGNIITGTVMTVATSIPDTVKLCKGEISGKEFTKNTASRAAGIAGGSAGWAGGAALGTAICPGIGTAIGALVGSIAAGAGASSASHKVLSWLGL